MELEPFDLIGPLPTGTTLLEASAGTGKTFTVGALVTRYVAEGVATLDEMLVITFGRAASQELRERVRDQLVQTERALADPAAATADRANPVVALLLRGSDDELATRRERLRDALASFDEATIATTHQFCHTVLRSLGVAGDTDVGTPLVDSLDDLVSEVVDDVYLRRFGQASAKPPFTRDLARTLAGTVVGDSHAALAAVADMESPAGARVGFAHEVRAEVERRKRRLGILAYDDLLGRLADALADPEAPARVRMRQRWSIVLVDEFQDTDPKQWEVLDRAFTGHATVVLIGDPKQAIYAFRGGDVATYLAASGSATSRATLDTNRRSDETLVDALAVVLRGAALGDPRIVVRDVTAAQPGSRLAGAPSGAPWRLRQVRREGFRLGKGKRIQAEDARAHIADDCAADIARLLVSDATWSDQPIAARHVAVLVAERRHGELVREALAARGVPAVVSGSGNVLASPAGDDWLTLLEALEQPHRAGRVRAASLTTFLGHTLADLDADADLTDRLSDRLRGWALLLRSRGVAALFEAAEERGLTARVLGLTGGERLMTDLRHVSQTLHETATRERLGPTALLEWLRTERLTSSQERTRRLDSDAAAVQITTVHQSKGLQYPVVYLPFASMKYVWPVDVARFHDDAGTRMLDVSGGGPQWQAHADLHLAEEAGEELRDLYVGLTRAQSQVVTWWAPTANTPSGGLHRLLFGRRPGQAEVPDTQPEKDDDYVAGVLRLLGEMGGPSPEVSEVTPAVARPTEQSVADLSARRFDRDVDTDWRRTSYSGLIRIEEQPAGVTSEPEREDWDPTQSEPGVRSETEASLLARWPASHALPSPMAALPSGATFGSLVHAVLEHADPAAPDLAGELRVRAADQLRWWPVAASADEISDGLLPSLHTPLGVLTDGARLVDIPLHDRLCELDFEFPLGGGDRARDRRDTRLRELGLLLTHHLPADDPLAPYADRLAGPLGDQLLRGYLSGSIDVVLRLPHDGDHRYTVVDYKTNLLGEPGTPTTTADYGRAQLAEAMLHSHYPLQALLYSVVLHRYLRWRIPDYEPSRHLGGVLYLFLRGMCGPETPALDGHVAGVFDWEPPASLVVALSDLLDGRTT